jgi:hypothetical protein
VERSTSPASGTPRRSPCGRCTTRPRRASERDHQLAADSTRLERRWASAVRSSG